MLKRKITLDFPLRYCGGNAFNVFHLGVISSCLRCLIFVKQRMLMSVLMSFKNEDNGCAPPKEVGRDRSQLCSNRVPPTLELEKKTEDAEELPTQCGSDGKRKETPGGRPVHGYV